MKIAVASDHAGYDYKQRLIAWLGAEGHEAIDFGAPSDEATDYPQWIRPAEEPTPSERARYFRHGLSRAPAVANRVPGVRCALCWNEQSARLGREHNDANAISIGQRMMDFETARRIVAIFLETAFEGGRHAARVAQIDAPTPRPH